MNDIPQARDEDSARILAIVAWVLFIVGWPTLHLATLGGVILAYIQRGDVQGTVWESHYEALINTFWTGLVIGVAGVIACVTVIGLVVGIPLLVGLVIWFLYRSIRGVVHAIESKPY